MSARTGAVPGGLSRRDFLRLVAAGGALALATACGGGEPALSPHTPTPPPEETPSPLGEDPVPTSTPTSSTATPTPAPTATPTAAPRRQLQLFSWWQDQGAREGYEALVRLFQRHSPHTDVANLAETSARGPNPRALLKARLLAGDPPDLFQARAGQGFIDPWVTLDKLEPLDELYKSAWLYGWVPKGMRDIAFFEGHFWCVPVSVQRTNVLWYNQRLFEERDLAPPETFNDLLRLARVFQTDEIVPLALGLQNPLEAAHLLETLLMSTLDAPAFRGLWTRETSWADAGVIEALRRMKQLLALANEDFRETTWEQALDRVMLGEAAMAIAGDWANARFRAARFSGYGWVPAPDTAGMFGVVADAFGLPRGAPNREDAWAWLELVASQIGQDTFNSIHGSIPPRIDGGKAAYDGYARWSMQEYRSSQLVASGVFGLAAREPWAGRIVEAANAFTEHRDVAQGQEALGQACLAEGACRG